MCRYNVVLGFSRLAKQPQESSSLGLMRLKLRDDESLTALEEGNWDNEAWVKKRTAGDHLALFLALPVIGHVVAICIGIW
jgi:hypothetical protein